MAKIDLNDGQLALSLHVDRKDVEGLVAYLQSDPETDGSGMHFNVKGELSIEPGEDEETLAVSLGVWFSVRRR